MNNNIKILILLIIIFKFNCKDINNFSSIQTLNIYKDANNQNSNTRKLNLLNIFGKNKKNLIISSVIKYSWDVIKNFFISLNNTNIENCDIVMFVGNFSEQTIEKIKSYGVTIYDIPKEFIGSKHRIHNYRFKLYEDFLIKNKDKYNMVFTADVRDTIFQKDIFQFYNNYHKPFLGVFLEEWYIKKDKINKYWAKLLCDVEKIQNNKIICVGTLIATINLLNYVMLYGK